VPALQIADRPVEIAKLTLTTAQLAWVLAIPRLDAYVLVRKGRLRNVSADRIIRLDVEEVLQYVQELIARDELSSLALFRLTELVSPTRS
jgi:hypothetical protein